MISSSFWCSYPSVIVGLGRDMHVSNCLAAPRTCSKPAVGFETRVAIMIAEEGFTTTGLMVTERNWLDVYPYASWGGNANLPVFQQGQQFIPQDILLRQVCDLWPPF